MSLSNFWKRTCNKQPAKRTEMHYVSLFNATGRHLSEYGELLGFPRTNDTFEDERYRELLIKKLCIDIRATMSMAERFGDDKALMKKSIEDDCDKYAKILRYRRRLNETKNGKTLTPVGYCNLLLAFIKAVRNQ